jgi:acyl-coenzyme A thioesterase PaaI-like protein
MSPAQAYTTLELKVSYHRALTFETGQIRAEGSVLSFGKRVAFAEGKLLDAAGRLCASATSTLLIFDKKPGISPAPAAREQLRPPQQHVHHRLD